MDNKFTIKEQRTLEKELSFQINGVGKAGQPHAKNSNKIPISHSQKNQLKMD